VNHFCFWFTGQPIGSTFSGIFGGSRANFANFGSAAAQTSERVTIEVMITLSTGQMKQFQRLLQIIPCHEP
jgi:hypothetical protein